MNKRRFVWPHWPKKFSLLSLTWGFGYSHWQQVGLLFLIYREEGFSGVWATLSIDVMRMVKGFAVILAIFFILTGAVNHLTKSHPQEFREIVTGKYGTTAIIALSVVMPGMAGGKQLQEAWNMPGTDKATLIICLVAMMGGSLTMYIFRAAFIGPNLTIIWTGILICLLTQVWILGKICKIFFP